MADPQKLSEKARRRSILRLLSREFRRRKSILIHLMNGTKPEDFVVEITDLPRNAGETRISVASGSASFIGDFSENGKQCGLFLSVYHVPCPVVEYINRAGEKEYRRDVPRAKMKLTFNSVECEARVIPTPDDPALDNKIKKDCSLFIVGEEDLKKLQTAGLKKPRLDFSRKVYGDVLLAGVPSETQVGILKKPLRLSLIKGNNDRDLHLRFEDIFRISCRGKRVQRGMSGGSVTRKGGLFSIIIAFQELEAYSIPMRSYLDEFTDYLKRAYVIWLCRLWMRRLILVFCLMAPLSPIILGVVRRLLPVAPDQFHVQYVFSKNGMTPLEAFQGAASKTISTISPGRWTGENPCPPGTETCSDATPYVLYFQKSEIQKHIGQTLYIKVEPSEYSHLFKAKACVCALDSQKVAEQYMKSQNKGPVWGQEVKIVPETVPASVIAVVICIGKEL